jgi:hypothetical protein
LLRGSQEMENNGGPRSIRSTALDFSAAQPHSNSLTTAGVLGNDAGSAAMLAAAGSASGPTCESC